MPDEQYPEDQPRKKRRPRRSGPSGLTPNKDRRLMRRAVREGWLKGERWQTDATLEDIKAKAAEDPNKLTVRERVLLASIKAMDRGSDREKLIAAKLGAALERQNQIDQHFLEQQGTITLRQLLEAVDRLKLVLHAVVPKTHRAAVYRELEKFALSFADHE